MSNQPRTCTCPSRIEQIPIRVTKNLCWRRRHSCVCSGAPRSVRHLQHLNLPGLGCGSSRTGSPGIRSSVSDGCGMFLLHSCCRRSTPTCHMLCWWRHRRLLDLAILCTRWRVVSVIRRSRAHLALCYRCRSSCGKVRRLHHAQVPGGTVEEESWLPRFLPASALLLVLHNRLLLLHIGCVHPCRLLQDVRLNTIEVAFDVRPLLLSLTLLFLPFRIDPRLRSPNLFLSSFQ